MSVVLPINPNDRVETYTLTGGQTVVSVPFPFQDAADIAVTRISVAGLETVLARPAQYTITGAAVPGGGTITLVTPGTAGEKIRVLGAAVLDRLTSIVRNGAFSSKAIDDELDRNRIIQQEQNRDLARAVKAPFGQTPPIFPMPVEDGRVLIGDAPNALGWGPSAGEISAAQSQAVAAAASAAASSASAVLAAAAAALAGSVAQPLHFQTVAQLVSDTVLSYTAGAGKVFVTAGSVIGARVWRYAVAASGATDHHIITAGGVKAYVIPINGVIETGAFAPNPISVQFAAALAAIAFYRVTALGNSWFPDMNTLRITPGAYTLDAMIEIAQVVNLYVNGHGVQFNVSTALTAFRVVQCPHLIIEGIHLNYRNNNTAAQAVLIAGQSSWSTLRRVGVTANSTNAGFSPFRLLQGDINGVDNNDRNKGNFWFTMDRCWSRKLAGEDANIISIAVDLQGCQNAFRANNCSFNNCETGVMIRNQASSLVSGASNDVQLHQTAFETYTGSAIKFQQDGGAVFSVTGGGAFQCRFESGNAVVESTLTGGVNQPFTLIGNTVISSVLNYILGPVTNFASLDTSTTPNWITPRLVGARGLTVGATNSGASLMVIPRELAAGGAIALQRADGTVDGRLSQRAGGGMDIDGGAVNIVRVNGVRGLSGTPTHSNNFRGAVLLLSGATTATVTFATAEPNATYYIFLDVPYNAGWAWVTAKTTGGFTLNVATAPGADQGVAWMLVR